MPVTQDSRSDLNRPTSARIPVTPEVPRIRLTMLTYIYETTDPSKPRREIEVRQSVHDDPLVVDPQTGGSKTYAGTEDLVTRF